MIDSRIKKTLVKKKCLEDFMKNMKQRFDSLYDNFLKNGSKEVRYRTLLLKTYSYIGFIDRIIAYHADEDIQKAFPQENPGRNIWCYDLKGNLL